MAHRESTNKRRGHVRGSGELWNPDIEWLLCGADAALGCRGTTGSVIGAIERGGASGSGDGDFVTDTQLGWGPHRQGDVARFRRLEVMWRRLDAVHQAVLRVHYVERTRAPSVIESRFGILAPVAMLLVASDAADKRVRRGEKDRQEAEREIGEARAKVSKIDGRLRRLVSTREPASKRWWRTSRARFLEVELRRRKSQLLELLARQARLESESQRALLVGERGALEAALKGKGKPPVEEIRKRADEAVRAAHRAWNDVERAAAEAWAS
jgi:hypothetical protein